MLGKCISAWVHINQSWKSFHLHLMGNNCVDFNTLGMHNFLGLSILNKSMRHIVLHAFFLTKKAKYAKLTILKGLGVGR